MQDHESVERGDASVAVHVRGRIIAAACRELECGAERSIAGGSAIAASTGVRMPPWLRSPLIVIGVVVVLLGCALASAICSENRHANRGTLVASVLDYCEK